MMRWKPLSDRTKMWFSLPIVIPILVCVAAAALALSPLWFPLHLYYKWMDEKGFHRWFAWHPVYDDGDWLSERPARWLWLEVVERAVPYYGKNFYRSLDAQAIEARGAETGTGSVNESAAPAGSAPNA